MISKVNSSQKLLTKWFKLDSPYQNQLYWKNISTKSKKNAFLLFKKASKQIPAYKDFLKVHKIDPEKIKSLSDFVKIPQTTKENYVEKYSLEQRCWNGKVENSSMISLSSGTSGNPHYWPRSLEHEINGAIPHEYLFKNIFNVGEKRTLFINGFAMGNWIAGTFTLICAQLVAWKGYPLTIMTPGYALNEVIENIENNAKYFDQIIVCGHTPFLKEIIDHLSERQIFSRVCPIKFLGTGQSITESWRKYVLEKIGSNDYEHTFVNLYGSTDAALMGFETPYSIRIRKEIAEKKLNEKFFKDTRVPSLFNYDPLLTFFESENKELIITKNSGAPLIRYNIKDEGDVLPANSFEKLTKQPHNFPFVYLFGREKFMVKVCGAIIYIEHAQHAFEQKVLLEKITGRFVMQLNYDSQQNQIFEIHVEMKQNSEPKSDHATEIKEVFIREVSMLNKEYADALSRMGEIAKPKIILHHHGDEPMFPTNKIKKLA